MDTRINESKIKRQKAATAEVLGDTPDRYDKEPSRFIGPAWERVKEAFKRGNEKGHARRSSAAGVAGALALVIVGGALAGNLLQNSMQSDEQGDRDLERYRAQYENAITQIAGELSSTPEYEGLTPEQLRSHAITEYEIRQDQNAADMRDAYDDAVHADPVE